jgi:site-specific recombinase XerC
MKKKQFTEAQIAFALREAESGTPVGEVIRKMGISEVTFYRWLDAEHGLNNPIANIAAPILGKTILPSLTEIQVLALLKKAHCVRDKAVIALFAESGLRLIELTNLSHQDIDWDNRTVRILGKGRKEGFAPFGELSGRYLKEWLSQYEPNGNI